MHTDGALIFLRDARAKPGKRPRRRYVSRMRMGDYRTFPMAKRNNVRHGQPEALQERLKQAALRDHDLGLEIASDWFAAGQEEAKSTSRRATRR